MIFMYHLNFKNYVFQALNKGTLITTDLPHQNMVNKFYEKNVFAVNSIENASNLKIFQSMTTSLSM